MSTSSSSWEKTKELAQSAYDYAGAGFDNVWGGIGQGYQDILIRGQLITTRDPTQDIALGQYPSDFDKDEYEQHLDQGREDISEPEPEDMEPWT